MGAAAERVADGEHAKTTEGVEDEDDEDGERDEGVDDVTFELGNVETGDGDGTVHVRHPAGENGANLSIFREEVLALQGGRVATATDIRIQPGLNWS